MYGSKSPINLNITFYVFNNSNMNPYFYVPTVSSSGGICPPIKLANENGLIVVYIDHKEYFPSLFVNAFSGLNRSSSYYQNWQIVDEPLQGSNIMDVAYKNEFSGNVVLLSSSIWNTSGNVGIGTNTPTERLSVNGNIRAKEIKVEATNWPDYVFKDEYELSSLENIHSFIKKNGHLPDVPKASEVEQNGISLGEMNKILLQKIEELTLHLIKKEKQLENQNSEILEIKKYLKLN